MLLQPPRSTRTYTLLPDTTLFRSRPLRLIQRAAHLFALGQQHMIFDVKKPRGVVGPLQHKAQLQEPARLVPQHGAVEGTLEGAAHFLHPVEKRLEVAAARVARTWPEEIGRAPCRESVCQYVKSSGGAG